MAVRLGGCRIGRSKPRGLELFAWANLCPFLSSDDGISTNDGFHGKPVKMGSILYPSDECWRTVVAVAMGPVGMVGEEGWSIPTPPVPWVV